MRASEDRAVWLSRFVLPYEPLLRGWLKKQSLNGLEIDDVIQETYCRLIELPSVADIRNVRAYMFQVAHSVVVHNIRRSKIVSFETLNELGPLDISEASSPENEALAKDELRQLIKAVRTLPNRAREVFVLRRLHGLSQKATAQTLGISERTVEKHHFRGLMLVLDFLSGKDRTLQSEGNGALEVREHSEGASSASNEV